jgi:ATP-dependent DNA ligase
MDGAFYKFIKDEDGSMELIGRSKSVSGDYLDKINWVPQLHDFFNTLPNGTCLLGEIYFPNNEGSSNVTTIMGCLEAKARERQEKGEKLHYYVFDVLAIDNESIYQKNIEDRVNELDILRKSYKNEEYIEFAKYYEGSELWNHLQETLSAGGEGVVITRKGTCYQPGKRPARQTLKVKKELHETIDCFFTGVAAEPTMEYTGKEIESWEYWYDKKEDKKLPKGNYYRDYSLGAMIIPVTKPFYNGWAGSLEIGVIKDNRVVPIGWISGLSDEIKSNWKDYKGKCIEITAMEVLETGGLRHAKLIQFRPDLSVSDCTWNKIYR